jgi:hypothetical protein
MIIRVYSTQTNSSEYAEYRFPQGRNGLPIKGRSVIIKGGAGVAQKRTLITPLGVATEISAAQLAFLENNNSFKRHVAAGFLRVIKSPGKSGPDASEVVADMEPRDGSSPVTPQDVEAMGKKLPTSGKDHPVSEITTKPRYRKPIPAFA